MFHGAKSVPVEIPPLHCADDPLSCRWTSTREFSNKSPRRTRRRQPGGSPLDIIVTAAELLQFQLDPQPLVFHLERNCRWKSASPLQFVARSFVSCCLCHFIQIPEITTQSPSSLRLTVFCYYFRCPRGVSHLLQGILFADAFDSQCLNNLIIGGAGWWLLWQLNTATDKKKRW